MVTGFVFLVPEHTSFVMFCDALLSPMGYWFKRQAQERGSPECSARTCSERLWSSASSGWSRSKKMRSKRDSIALLIFRFSCTVCPEIAHKFKNKTHFFAQQPSRCTC